MPQEQKITATLKIVLKANDIDIAESSDQILWQKVLAAINDLKITLKKTALAISAKKMKMIYRRQRSPLPKCLKKLV